MLMQVGSIRRAWTVIGIRGKQASPTAGGSAARDRKSVGRGGQSKASTAIHGLPSRSALATQPLGRAPDPRKSRSGAAEVRGATWYQV